MLGNNLLAEGDGKNTSEAYRLVFIFCVVAKGFILVRLE